MCDKLTTIVITGPPNVGKTTIVKKVVKEMQQHQVACSGFYTEEVRSENGSRFGFDVVTLNGQRSILARDSQMDQVRRPKIGKYCVYTKDFEDLTLPLLKISPKGLLVVDEIGKMELLSSKFKQRICEIFGKTFILATVPIAKHIDVVERMKADKTSIVFEVSRENRNRIVSDILMKVQDMMTS